MPFLKGGAKHRNSPTLWEFIRRKITGKTRNTGTQTKEIRKILQIGSGGEGKIFEVEVVVEKNGKQKKLKMAKKEFFSRGPYPNRKFTFSPVEQFELMNTLVKLNKTKKLGLRIVPTMRLLEEKGKPSLVITKLDVADLADLSPEQKQSFDNDRVRQVKIMHKLGYWVEQRAFFPIVDKKTKQCVAMLVDFGEIRERDMQ